MKQSEVWRELANAEAEADRKAIPSADVVMVARCKDCKHYKGLAECNILGECMGTNGFCSWGEREEDNEAD